MRPAFWVRAAFYASLFTCIFAAGAVAVLSDRFEKLSRAIAADTNNIEANNGRLQTAIEHLSDEIRFSAPADLGHKHADVRDFIIRSNLAQVDGPIVFVGDSITEIARLPASLCGHPVVNAGLAGATSRSYLNFANGILSKLRAPIVVVAFGTNDAQTAARKGEPFAKSYKALIDFLKPHTEALVLVGVPPLEMDKSLASGYFDKVASEENDTIIKTMAKDQSAQFADVRSTMRSENSTVDGVHLTPGGYKEWMTAVSAAISRTLDCQSASN